ncbi:MAG: proline dehydrogenase family protein [Bryobacteraceae bacterium]|nr:proline dehydrogenase family protein [Bryobacteraceae bacterium]
MLRHLLLSLSRRTWLRHWVERSRVAQLLTRRFVAGRSLDQAFEACRALREERIFSTLDYLGENVTTLEEARKCRDAYLSALGGIADYQLGGTVSIKLTQMGLDISEGHCRENVRMLAERALEIGAMVEIDMESSAYTERTLAVVRDQHAHTGNVRAVIQAYLRRSASDVEALCAQGIPVRLCKGAYQEDAEVAFPGKREVDENYSRLMRLLLEKGAWPAIASHDERLIREAMEIASSRRMAPDAFEFQMLFGIRRDLQKELVGAGFRLRVYVPYGDAWYPYFMRRMAERPANLWFVVRNLIRV